jgi:hypothetical protein
VNSRCCSRPACKRPPVCTLTYVYKDSTAVLGPLAAYVDPHSWDLCETHAARLVVPRGWDVVRLPPDPAQERADDLEALANIVRESGRSVSQGRGGAQRPAPSQPRPGAQPRQGGQARAGGQPMPAAAEPVGQGVEVVRRGHLRVVRSAPVQQPDS